MKKCAENFNRFCPDYPEKCHLCGAFREETNADRIRALTDEEIAEAASFRFCPSEMIDKSCVFRNCKECWVEWLQQPAEEDDHA